MASYINSQKVLGDIINRESMDSNNNETSKKRKSEVPDEDSDTLS
ncbi:25407_t:CDS:1, partial [Racocetra persica]